MVGVGQRHVRRRAALQGATPTLKLNGVWRNVQRARAVNTLNPKLSERRCRWASDARGAGRGVHHRAPIPNHREGEVELDRPRLTAAYKLPPTYFKAFSLRRL